MIVRNCGARNGKGIKDFGDYLPLAAEASQGEVTIIWVLVPQSDSIRHLRTFLKTLPDVRVIVAKNTRAPGSFYGLYDGTDLEQQILDRRGASFEIPTLSPDLVNKMKIDKPGVKNHRMTLDEIASLSSSLNIAVIRARKLFDKAVGGLING